MSHIMRYSPLVQLQQEPQALLGSIQTRDHMSYMVADMRIACQISTPGFDARYSASSSAFTKRPLMRGRLQREQRMVEPTSCIDLNALTALAGCSGQRTTHAKGRYTRLLPWPHLWAFCWRAM